MTMKSDPRWPWPITKQHNDPFTQGPNLTHIHAHTPTQTHTHTHTHSHHPYNLPEKKGGTQQKWEASPSPPFSPSSLLASSSFHFHRIVIDKQKRILNGGQKVAAWGIIWHRGPSVLQKRALSLFPFSFLHPLLIKKLSNRCQPFELALGTWPQRSRHYVLSRLPQHPPGGLTLGKTWEERRVRRGRMVWTASLPVAELGRGGGLCFSLPISLSLFPFNLSLCHRTQQKTEVYDRTKGVCVSVWDWEGSSARSGELWGAWLKQWVLHGNRNINRVVRVLAKLRHRLHGN